MDPADEGVLAHLEGDGGGRGWAGREADAAEQAEAFDLAYVSYPVIA